jgi:hypothetical protein
MSTDDEGGPTGQPGEIVRTDWRDYTHPTTAVIERVADTTGHDVRSLPSLHEAVDTDALDELLTGVEDDDAVQVSFSYCDLWITVRSDRSIVLHPDE